MLSVVALLGAPTEREGQAAIAPVADPLVDPVTGYVINRWNKKWSGRSLPVVKGRKRISGLGGGHGLWTPAIDAAASFCAYRNTKYALDGVWTINHKDTCAAACNYVNAAGWVLSEEHQIYDSVSNDTNNADVWYNGVTGTTEGNGPSPLQDESDLVHGANCMIAFHGATPTEGHNRGAVNDEAIYGEYKGTSGIAKRWTEELETMFQTMATLHGSMHNFGKSMKGELYVTGHAEGGTMASIFAYLANHKDDPMDFGRHVTKLTVYGVPPSANFSMTNGQRKDGCFDGTAYYTRIPKHTPYVDSKNGLSGHLVDIYSIMGGYPVTKEVQDGVRFESIFEDLDHVGIHIKHAIHTRKSQHINIQWRSLDMTGMVTDEVIDPTQNLQHLRGPVHFNKCGNEPPSFKKMANDKHLAIRAANESELEWKALTMEGYIDQKIKCLTRDCAGIAENALEHGADALNMHAPETYCFSLCIMDHECMGFLLMGGEPHRDIHEGDDHPGSATDSDPHGGPIHDMPQ